MTRMIGTIQITEDKSVELRSMIITTKVSITTLRAAKVIVLNVLRHVSKCFELTQRLAISLHSINRDSNIYFKERSLMNTAQKHFQ